MMMKGGCANQNDNESKEENDVSWGLHIDGKDEAIKVVFESREKREGQTKTRH